MYGQLEFDLSDTLELAIAARYDREDREVNNKVPNVTNSGLNVNLVDPATFAPLPINPALAGGDIPSRKQRVQSTTAQGDAELGRLRQCQCLCFVWCRFPVRWL